MEPKHIDWPNGPQHTLAQIRARELNWGIFCIRGMMKLLEIFHHRRMVSPSTYSRLHIALDDAIEDIYREHAVNGWQEKSRRGE